MTFQEAMAEVVEQAQEEDRAIYLYQGRGVAWQASARYWDDWLFKAYPGGRKELSRNGNKILQDLQSTDPGWGMEVIP